LHNTLGKIKTLFAQHIGGSQNIVWSASIIWR
jgi:hypothetical protein